MSLIALLLICSTLILVVSQFGSRLAARNSFVWWTTSAFIMVAAIRPEYFRSLTHVLGIDLVSNFVLASLIMFLYLQLLELTSESTTQTRKMRHLVSNIASEDFVAKAKILPKDGKVRVLVVLPTFNEEEALEETIHETALLKDQVLSHPNLDLHICFVNDGSYDKTPFLLAAGCPSSYTSHRVNIGVAGVLLTAFQIARSIDADFVVQCDSDGQHPIQKIPELVEYAAKNELDLLVGSRFQPSDRSNAANGLSSTTVTRLTGIQMIRSMLVIFGAKARIFDPTSGFRVYSKYGQAMLFKNMPDEYPEPESIAILALKGCRIGETPVTMLPRTKGESSIKGFKTLRFMIKVLTALLGLRLRTLFPSKT